MTNIKGVEVEHKELVVQMSFHQMFCCWLQSHG